MQHTSHILTSSLGARSIPFSIIVSVFSTQTFSHTSPSPLTQRTVPQTACKYFDPLIPKFSRTGIPHPAIYSLPNVIYSHPHANHPLMISYLSLTNPILPIQPSPGPHKQRHTISNPISDTHYELPISSPALMPPSTSSSHHFFYTHPGGRSCRGGSRWSPHVHRCGGTRFAVWLCQFWWWTYSPQMHLAHQINSYLKFHLQARCSH